MLKPASRSATKAWQFWLKLVVSIALLALLLAKTDLQALGTLFRSLRISIFFGSILLYLLAQLLSTVRWRCLLQAEKIHLPFWRLILLYYEGMFFNLMLPTAIGGDLVRGYRVSRLTERREASLASILVERLSGFVALAIIGCIAIIPAYAHVNDPLIVWLMAGSAAGMVALIASLLSDRLQALFFRLLHGVGLGRFHDTVHRLYEAVQQYWTHRRALLVALGLSLILQSMVITIFFLISQALNLSVPLRYFFLFVPLISVISMLPISVAGLGLREGSAVYLFSKVGMDSAGAISLSLLWFAVTALCSGLGGIAFLVGHSQHQIDP
ncbi:lysylphosphatidylglycerol synthase transmembrane domain-containing protein [Candidatus Methylomirabilis sp.]|uniref:lysylphosphatidylglycerol synthase transmembrane domain-containing protein n=1 Tax=Candidatus Methylomirabilis sp. TaxID=2032687 RepID=UPI002A693F5E|nr:lysylphosphatidylglycerol synthase transmembrane domain-containing protein [Candidatus Methylomirabilis sp.]